MFFLPYDDWRISRAVISHIFTTTNLKRISFLFENEIETLITNLKSATKNSGLIDIEILIDDFLLDIVLKSFFGISIDFDNEKKTELLENVSKILNIELSFHKIFSYFSPKVAKFFGIELIDEKAINYLKNLMKNIIQKRIEDKTAGNDFLQYLLDARNEDNIYDKNESKVLE